MQELVVTVQPFQHGRGVGIVLFRDEVLTDFSGFLTQSHGGQILGLGNEELLVLGNCLQ